MSSLFFCFFLNSSLTKWAAFKFSNQYSYLMVHLQKYQAQAGLIYNISFSLSISEYKSH